MNKALLLAVPVLAIIAAAGFAVAQPFWTSPQNMTAEEKSLSLQVLEQKQQMLQDQKDYLNGLITQEQYQDRLDQHQQTMLSLRQQLRDALQADPNYQGGVGCPMGGHGWGRVNIGRGMGHGMMWGF